MNQWLNDRIRKKSNGKGMKLCQAKFRLDFRKMFFPERMAGHKNRVPKETVMTPSLSEFKECLDGVFSHTVL